MLHVSEIDWKRIENVEDVLKEGQEIEVKLISIDPKSGKLKLSRKVLLPKPEKNNLKKCNLFNTLYVKRITINYYNKYQIK